MTEMLARDKAQMDKVGFYHPDFTRAEVPGSGHYIPLGSYIDKGMTSCCAVFTYDFSVHGGAITPDIALGQLPAGLVVTGVITDVITPVTGTGTKWILKVNGSVVTTIADPTALTGAAVQTATAKKTINQSTVYLNIDDAVTTAGKVRFLVQYVMP
jgi:hypothetical protein